MARWRDRFVHYANESLRSREDEPRQAGGNPGLRAAHGPAQGDAPSRLRHPHDPYALGVLPRPLAGRPAVAANRRFTEYVRGWRRAGASCRRLRLLRPLLHLYTVADGPDHSARPPVSTQPGLWSVHERDATELGEPGNQLLRGRKTPRRPVQTNVDQTCWPSTTRASMGRRPSPCAATGNASKRPWAIPSRWKTEATRGLHVPPAPAGRGRGGPGGSGPAGGATNGRSFDRASPSSGSVSTSPKPWWRCSRRTKRAMRTPFWRGPPRRLSG